MANVLKPGTGSTVAYVTSVAPKHPGSDALAEDKKSFWVTTGVFPQEIVVRLSRKTPINTIKLLSVNAHEIAVERSIRDTPRDFQPIITAELPDDGLHLENISAGGAEATFLKLKILSGHGEFVAVYNISATSA